MSRVKYPICVDCGEEIDPRYDNCDKYYQVHDGPLCRDCFLSRETEYIELNTDEYAALIGAGVVHQEAV